MENWDDYTEINTPADGDTFLEHDVSETTVGQKMKRITWANIKATLKTYFDTLFAPITGSDEYIAAVTPGTAGNVLTSNGTDWTSAAAAGGSSDWNAVSDTWAYASATTITVPSGAQTKYTPYSKVKFTQHSVTKYGYINPTSDTVLTFYAGSDFAIENTATYPITNIYYSNTDTPLGFPIQFNFTPVPTNLTLGNGTMTGSFSIKSKKVDTKILVVFGNTTSISGDVKFDLPITSISYGDNPFAIGFSSLVNTGTALYMGATVIISTTQVSIRAIQVDATYATWKMLSSTVPMTWATTMTLGATFSYIGA